jgi:hypothetical protein
MARLQMREFNAAFVALAVLAGLDVQPLTEDFLAVDLEGGQGSRPVSAGISCSSGTSSTSS